MPRGRKKRRGAQSTDLIFPKRHHELFNAFLTEQNLKKDREGQARSAYSLRHTYICLRLLAGADIYQIAKNCRTSVEMIEKYYASHIETSIDAAASTSTRKSRPRRSRRTPRRKIKPLYLTSCGRGGIGRRIGLN